MKRWLIKKLFNSFLIRSTPIMLNSSRGNSWYFIDHYNQMWTIRYTGDREMPFRFELKEYL